MSDRRGTGFLKGQGEGAHLANQGIPVELQTIDEICGGEATAIKMDIEGTEVAALYGAQKTLSNVRKIAVECDGTYETVVELLRCHGFKTIRTYTELVPIRSVLKSLISQDFIIDECKARFRMLQIAISDALAGRNPVMHLRRSKKIIMLFAFR